PKGVGGLYVRRRNPRVKVAPVIYGGGHELGMRSGTLNVPGIVGMGKAYELALVDMKADAEKYRNWTRMMFDQFRKKLEGVELNGMPIGDQRLPHNLNISINGIESKSLVVQIKGKVAIATGSACTTVDTKPSHVIKALGFGEDRAHNAIRIGVGRANTEDMLSDAINAIVDGAKKLSHLLI
ncbi:MAG: aminotransferase class V-fold PLP-dependent enzyme, partial [Anaerolineae bacterium]|nr:aminotransferase class V-fold PLP-dependent enzyme [Anaerolineae bacterium]